MLQVEPGTEAITDAVQTFNHAASTYMLNAGRLTPQERAERDADLMEKYTALADTVHTHLESLAQQPKPSRRWRWRRKHASAVAGDQTLSKV